jgi:hypothetical protein
MQGKIKYERSRCLSDFDVNQFYKNSQDTFSKIVVEKRNKGVMFRALVLSSCPGAAGFV